MNKSGLIGGLSYFTSCRATAVDEDGKLVGRGGAILVKGRSTLRNSVNTLTSRYEGNTAGFGNDMFIEKEMVEEFGVDGITTNAGVSYSQWPHLEIEGHTSDDTERKRIAAFLDFPTIRINTTYPNDSECKWGGRTCRTLSTALSYLASTCVNGSLYSRLEAITLINQSIALSSTRERGTKITLPASIVEECSFFVINDISRLSTEKLSFSLKPHHRVIDVESADGWFEMKNCVVILESGKTTALSPILSVGNGLVLSNTLFNSSDEASPASLSVPAIDYRPTGSKQGPLGAGPFAMSGCSLTNLTFTQTPAIVVETSDELTFSNQIFTSVSTDPTTGQELWLKGSSFKQQLNPSLWTGSFSASKPELLMGEDTAMDAGHKWRESSLVYWLVSPEVEVVLDAVDEKAHDHPNCGSIEFKCNTLESAFSSSFLNKLSIISLSSSTSIDVPLLIQMPFEIKSVFDTIQTVAIEKTGSFEMDKPSSTLTFTSLAFALSSSCTSEDFLSLNPLPNLCLQQVRYPW
ncbi:hypothetical protein BLNAU_8511 [Blattamonas nauphoetae]|uniref:Uncharacterized protein n=1 Tax=Blattamonas nauphoetae TaxID=2049346 RepID=A0ABQ9XY84_9EUKA|nr:hypothetical protein BLNAU_8511 [Blattamonas nauphoetae]